MKKVLFFITIVLLISTASYCVKIDGRFWDWTDIGDFHKCRSRALSRDRSGLDMDTVKLHLTGKFLYIYVEGRSVKGKKPDDGSAVKGSSIRVSFSSSQSPLNRVRISTEPSALWQIKVSKPEMESVVYGSKKNKYWSRGRIGRKYAFEIKIPVFRSTKGVHIGVAGGPIIAVSEDQATSRNSLSEVLINSVDMKTHRLVDTVSFTIKKGMLQ